MLKLFESTKGMYVLSLRTGGPIAVVGDPIINPNNLFIEGWYVQDTRTKEVLILLSQDIREVLPQGFAVNDHEVLTPEDELVRLKEILGIGFGLIGLRVSSTSGKNYGKITDFALETNSFYVQKLYASQPIVRNFSGGTLSIDRTQIIEITNRRVVIEEPSEKVRAPAVSPTVAA